ncbi:MAG: penicillin-binding protein activator [Alphaproteobacteria bacterium]|nr:penicillin-binding protein activator [Alphaproteobacteria bacterium]
MAEQPSHRQGRRRPLLVALTALGLAGCALVPAPAVQAPPPAAAAPPAEPVRTAPPPLTEASPPPTRDLPRDEARNRVAVLVPLSGPNAGVGQSLANAATLALLDAGGDRIRLTVYDTAKTGAAAAAQQALADGNRLFLGPLLAEDVRAVAPVARRADVPVVSFSNDVSVAGSGVFLMGFTPSSSVARVVGYARAQGLARFAALTPRGVYGRRVGQAMIDATERAGGRLVGIQEFDRDVAGLRAAAGRLGAYDAVLIADAARTAALAVPAIRAAVPRAHILGTELWGNDPAIGSVAGLRGAWYAAVPDTLFNQMRSRYRTRYGAAPYRLASLAYDAVLLAIRTSRDWRPGGPYPQRALRDPAGFTGIDGAYRFAANGVAVRALEVREVTASGSVVVSPASDRED